MYVYSDLIESQVAGDAQANVLIVTEEVKLSTYHRLRSSVFSSMAINMRHGPTDTIYISDRLRSIAFSTSCIF